MAAKPKTLATKGNFQLVFEPKLLRLLCLCIPLKAGLQELSLH